MRHGSNRNYKAAPFYNAAFRSDSQLLKEYFLFSLIYKMIQLEMIDRVKLLATENTAISSVLMYGSFAKGEGDAYSDIEFYIFLNSDANFSKEAWVNRIEETALFFVNEFGTDVAIFKNMIRGEFHFLDVSRIDIVKTWEGLVSFEYWENMILVDKDGKLSEVFQGINKGRPMRNDPENILWLQHSLVNMALFTRNLLLREEWAHAHNNLTYMHKYLLWLIRIRVDSTVHWESPTKKAEQDLPHAWHSRYVACTSALNEEKLKEAFKECLSLATALFKDFKAPPEILNLISRIQSENQAGS